MRHFLDLTNRKPIFYGSNRVVYVHPEDPDFFVKVARPRAVKNYLDRIPKWKRRFKILGGGLPQSFREFREYMRLNLPAAPVLPYIFVSAGFVATSEGWGHVVKAERGEDGNYAPTLASIINEPGKYEKPLADFLSWVVDTPAAFTNLQPWNLVLAQRDGKNQIVSIDGLGERCFIQFRAYFPSINKRKNRRRVRKLLWRIEELKAGRIGVEAQEKMKGTVASTV
ncbi:MAG: hypothetical protein DU429_08895 [Candidatus Tokpelaia sp.]|uniref:YrbL family protein n=1 Tax=Candidatus Tokpelaia sp. TaxID=2233777 RepID=UPI0012817051|nr:YrbL family protein [Candidatus Tokpelaia sp.]KAA6204779.1 MAG: hypothetical protein DU429_08895 [Candidatus Tokpelaia sp.]KAA6206582.1 MAG: hypothetical protein DU430_00380 [Candidatus Tokpelaia sp.]